MLLSFFIVLWITVTLAIMLENNDNISDILGYVPKTSNVGTRSFGPTVSFTALTVMLRHSSDNDYGISA